MADKVTVEKLEAEHAELGAKAEVRAQDLAKMRARLGELPSLLVEAEGKQHADLAAEYGRLKAQDQVLTAELRWLKRQQGAALVAVYRLREEQAQSTMAAYYDGEYRQAITDRDQAIVAARHAQNRRPSPTAERAVWGAELIELNVQKERAIGHVRLVVAPRLEELKRMRDQAREEREQAEEAAARLLAEP